MKNRDEEIMNFVERGCVDLGCSMVGKPIFSENNDSCLVSYETESGKRKGFVIIFLVWEDKEGTLLKKIVTKSSKDDLVPISLRQKKGKILVDIRIERTISIPMLPT